MKKIFLGANWKMNPSPAGALEKGSPYFSDRVTDVVVFPTFLDLDACVKTGLTTGAQCGRSEGKGAFTGDISMQIIKAAGATHVLCGHSEHRAHHSESNEQVIAQVHAAIAAGLIPVLCVGETADQREMGETEEILAAQLTGLEQAGDMLIAYEPVWAIGTGKTPTPTEANATHAFIQSKLSDKNIRILYGGSMTAANAAEFLAQPEIDGGLIGGASLKPEEFRLIVEAAKNIKK